MVLLAAAIWGCIGIFTRNLSAIGFDSWQMTAMKCLINAGMMFCFILITDRKKFRIKKGDIPWFLANGILSIAIFMTAYNKATTMISLSAAVVLLYTAPVWVMLLSAIFFHEKLTARKGLCLVLCVLGSTLVSGILTNGADINGFGLLMGLISGIGYGLYSIFSSVIVKKYHPYTNVFYTFLIAGIATMIPCDMGETADLIFSSGRAFFWVLANGAVTSFIPYILYTLALKKMNASRAAILATIEPVVATLMGTFLYKEPLTFISLIGMSCVFVALVLSNLPEKEAHKFKRDSFFASHWKMT